MFVYEGDLFMTDAVVSKILIQMNNELSDMQLEKLNSVLFMVLVNYDISPKSTEIISVDNTWRADLNDFLIFKRIEGRKASTVKKYNEHLIKLLSYLNKPVSDIVDDDIFRYITEYKAASTNISNRSLENMRLVFSSFFSWAYKKRRIIFNPMISVNKIKYDYIIKQPFDEDELETIYNACESKRDTALISFLYSTGVRVSELINTNIKDVDFNKKELTVYGKGGKEREVYLNARAKSCLQDYLKTRNISSENEPLFVCKRTNNRLSVSGVEYILHEIGNRCGIKDIHPHKFRHTTATIALSRGMEISYVSTMLGHQSVNTTMLYCKINNAKVKQAHEIYLCA